MEIPAQSLSHAKLPKPPSFPISFHSRSSLFASKTVPNIPNKNTILTQLHGVTIKPRKYNKTGVVFANSEAQNPPPDVSTDRWLLEPVGQRVLLFFIN